MSGKKYAKEFEIHYYEINKHQEATPTAILNYLEETAIAHSEAVGYGIEKLKAQGAGWVLNRWLVRIDAYPAWGEKIVVETWASDFTRFYATREFYIKDAQGKVLGRASSLWVFLNTEKKRPVRIPHELGEAYGADSRRALEMPFQELEAPANPEFHKEFFVRRSDIDTNNHVNNIKYIEWVVEVIPQEVYDYFTLSSLEIIYKKETGYGAMIASNCQRITQDAFTCEYAHSILNKASGEEIALARTTWKKR